uniref:Uncharacterized protein n=1 Tax=Peronospora matthiolae TaxID=2874970 RepID=A0AAV1UFW1_9STRA
MMPPPVNVALAVAAPSAPEVGGAAFESDASSDSPE